MNLKKFKYVSVDVLIGKDTVLAGDITSHSAIKIDGIVHGNIQTDREVIVSDGAVIEGNLTAGALIVAGTLTGNATVADQLVVKSTGTINGDIETGSLVIEEGGVFIGMNRAVKVAPPTPSNENMEV